MDIFMQNIPASFRGRDNRIKESIAQVLHSPPYTRHSPSPLNFVVHVFRKPGRQGFLQGTLTMPTVDIAQQFLSEFGGASPRRTLEGLRIKFQPSRKTPRAEILEASRLPYASSLDNTKTTLPDDQSRSISVRTIQFGWACRDEVFSVEWEKHCSGGCHLIFDTQRREFQVQIQINIVDVRMIVIQPSQIYWGAAGMGTDGGRMPIIHLSLLYPPSFELKSTLVEPVSNLFTTNSGTPSRKRLTALDEDNPMPSQIYIGLRLVCETKNDIGEFRSICNTAARVKLDHFIWPVEYRELFSPAVMEQYSSWVEQLDWLVAFQIEAMARTLLVNIKEILELRPEVDLLTTSRGIHFTATFLRHVIYDLQYTMWEADAEVMQGYSTLSVKEFFQRSLRNYTPPSQVPTSRPSRTAVPDTFECLRVTITPTSMYLEGPLPDRSNRVMRQYHDNTDSFIRVTFVQENELQFRFDRDIDGRGFIHKRVGGILANGFMIAGRKFEFLAYSQSALKEHAVYFVKPFIDGERGLTNARTIISALGTFSNLTFDRDLIRCPARYGARISQAFTATDSSVSVEAEEIFTLEDITRGESCFTDGVGTISTDLARAIWRDLRHKNRRARKAINFPRAFQIRFQGSKGMISVDYSLQGRAIGIRPSMIKFEAPNSTVVEIARAFDRPGRYFLNRPLIMILEGLGVPHQVFQDLQDTAVEEAQDSVLSLDTAGRLLEAHGLGNSFRLPSVMLSLHKLGLDPPEDNFWHQMMDFAINHVLRELKYRARIPVPNSWTLVGVADIHKYLQAGEVFAAVVPSNGSTRNPIYLEGPVLVSRSPTIHPGDVQVVHAIGRPPAGSPFEREPLYNTIVFSVRGERSLPSCLGGGDLDGDEYNVTIFLPLHPPRSFPPAPYKPSVKKLLDRHSTMADVADFVTEFIYSDNLGIIAITWLIIADQSPENIFHPKCLLLSDLHSDAVDYPKTGQPVPLQRIPKLERRIKPDWNAPETTRHDRERYYESPRAIGRLYRAIDLPALPIAAKVSRRQRHQLKDGETFTLEDVIQYIWEEEPHNDDPVQLAIQRRVRRFISVSEYDDAIIGYVWQLYQRYASDLQGICIMYTLSRSPSEMLTEAEAIIGTIVAQSSQPRMRKDKISRLREQTAIVIGGIREELAGEEDEPLERTLERAWVAYRIAIIEQDAFGARSFAWIAMGEIFATIKAIEEEEGT